GFWYFVGHCHLRNGLRLFRVDRVMEIEAVGEKFARPAGLDSQRALLDAVAGTTSDEWSVEVLLEAGEEDVRWQISSVGFALEAVEGGTLLRCSTRDLGWISRVLASLDCDFVVLHPKELRDALLRRAEEIAALAKRQ
ncbi:MAG: helix-turn-helix transcriptional regulator, partial [Rubrobacteraceae bacterium]